jgi:hypothetical protein
MLELDRPRIATSDREKCELSFWKQQAIERRHADSHGDSHVRSTQTSGAAIGVEVRNEVR